jgi:cytochrome P450
VLRDSYGSDGRDFIVNNADGSQSILPKGANCVIVQIIPNHNVKTFPNPDLFNSSRWENPTQAQKDAAKLIFGLGPRNCVWQALTKVELDLVLPRLARDYDFVSRDRRRVHAFYHDEVCRDASQSETR